MNGKMIRVWGVAVSLAATGAPAPAAEGDAAGRAQNTVGQPPRAVGSQERGGPGTGSGSDAAASNPAVGRTERTVGAAQGGSPTRDPGHVTEMGSPGTETNPGTAGPSTASPNR